MNDLEQTVGCLIDNASVTIVGSVDEDGVPNTKALLPPRKREGIARIFFSTNTSSLRIRQFLRNPRACLYFFDRRYSRGVMLKGTMDVLHDPPNKE